MARQIKAEIVGDASSYKRATKEAVDHTHKFGGAIAGIAAGGAFAVFNLATDAVRNFVGQLGSAADMYRADEVSQERLRQSLQNNVPGWDGNTAAVERYAAAQQRLGFQDDDIRASFSQLLGITHDVAKAQADVALAQDLARAKGIDLATATDIVTKAAQGNGKALKAMGVDVGKAKTGAEMLDAIQKNVKGSAEAWAKTAEGKQAAANAKNAESWERIGSIVSRLQSIVLPLVAEAFDRVSNFVITNLVPAFMQVWAAAQQIWQAFMGLLAPALDYIKANFESLKPILIALAVTVGIVVGLIILAILAVIAIVVGLVAAFIWLKQKHAQIFDGIRNKFGELVGWVAGLPGRISSAAKGMWDGIWNAFRSMLNFIVRAWNSLKFTIPAFDFLGQHTPSVTLSVPHIPSFQQGTGPGGLPYTGLFYGHKGEAVTPAGRGGGEIHIHMHGMVIDGPAMDRFFREGLARARVVSGT